MGGGREEDSSATSIFGFYPSKNDNSVMLLLVNLDNMLSIRQ